ncbi:MAG: glutaredoxin domain-containing protein [Burkholderiales bacterium]
MKHDCVDDRARTRLNWLCWAPLVALLAAVPAQAQYKVIGPDGKVTYTDRPPAPSAAKITSLSSRGVESGPTDPALPLELRQSAAKYPVTLYTVTGACDPCQSARQLLRQRGIPYAEKQVLGPEDSEALERLSGGRDAPTLAIGSQMMRGFAPEVWSSYLDAAGYPRESRLPASYQYAAATPIVERAAARAPAARASQPDATPTAPPAASPSGIKF